MSYKKTTGLGAVNNVSITGASVAGGGQRAYGGGSGSLNRPPSASNRGLAVGTIV